MAELTCPFCNDTDFDAIGLKLHLQRGWCDAFNETPATDRPEPVKPLAMTKPNLGCAFNCEWPTKCCALGTMPNAPGVAEGRHQTFSQQTPMPPHRSEDGDLPDGENGNG